MKALDLATQRYLVSASGDTTTTVEDLQKVGTEVQVPQGGSANSSTGGVRNSAFSDFGWWPYGNNKSSLGHYNFRVIHAGLSSSTFSLLVPSDGRLGFQNGTAPASSATVGNHFRSDSDGIQVCDSAGNLTAINAQLKVAQYTFATLPAASASTSLTVQVTDRDYRLVTSNGTNWLWCGTTTVAT